MRWRVPDPRRSAVAVWGVAVLAYVVAVLHRTSFGVAGVDAVARYDVGATVLAAFVVVQLVAYTAMQVPVGVLLDRYGSRVLVAGGAALMAAGQVLLATSEDLPLALTARVLIGVGDAATFISVIRLVTLWFPARRVPVFTQLSGLLGQLGQVVAALPLAAALHSSGWRSAFLGLGAVGVLAAALVWGLVRDRPPGGLATAVGPFTVLGPLRAAARTPGTWLGFWSHWVTGFSMTVVVLLWGFPFLEVAQERTPAQAGALMTVAVVSAMVSGPVIGLLTGRHPLRRSWMVLTIAAALLAVWAAVLVRDEPSPTWLLVVFLAVLGMGGPGSMIGFDFARTSNAAERIGTATGLVNTGAFTAALLSMLAVGAVLDLVGGAEPLSLAAFRVALSVLLVPWAIAVVGVLATRRTTRRAMAAEGVVVPPVRDVVAARRAARTAAGRGRAGARSQGYGSPSGVVPAARAASASTVSTATSSSRPEPPETSKARTGPSLGP